MRSSGDSVADARADLTDALAGVDLPETVTTPYGEVVQVERYVQWLYQWDQPTLHALAAVIRAARETQG